VSECGNCGIGDSDGIFLLMAGSSFVNVVDMCCIVTGCEDTKTPSTIANPHEATPRIAIA
jgi:hypothetical protein